MAGTPPTRLAAAVHAGADRLAAWLRVAAALMIAAMAVTTMAEVLLRFLFSYPLPWAGEFARTLFVWSVMLGVAVATWTRAHIAVTVLDEVAAPAVRRAARLVALAAMLVLALLLLVEGASFAEINLGNITPAMQVSLGWGTSGIAAGGLFMTLFAALLLAEELVPALRRGPAREVVP